MMKKLLIFALAAFAFAACNEDDVNTLEGPGNVVEPPMEYTITTTNCEATIDGEAVEAAFEGDEITLTYEEMDNHEFQGWYSFDVTVGDDGTFTMPAKNVAVTALFDGIPYEITLEDGAVAKVDGVEVEEATVGQEVVLTHVERVGYEFTGWTVSGVVVTDNKFEMPGHPVTVTPQYVSLSHTLTLIGCTSNVAAADVKTGVEITLTPTTELGMEFLGWDHPAIVTEPINLTIGEDGKFIMPAHDLTIEVGSDAFEPIVYTITTTNCVADLAEGIMGTIVTLDWTPVAGKMFDGWNVTPSTVTVDGNFKFKMPADNVTVEAKFVDNTAAKTGNILYWDTSAGTGDTQIKLAVGDWGTVTYDNLLYTKFGSVLGFTYNTTWDATTGNVKNNYTMIARDFTDYSKIPPMAGTPGSVVGFVTTNHTNENLGNMSAKGDICKLVGMTLGQMKQRGGMMGATTLADYDSGGYRLPTQPEMNTLYPASRMKEIELDGVKGMTVDGTAATFLPHVGQVSDPSNNGNSSLSQRGVFGIWWTADCVPAAMMPTMFSAYGAYRTMPGGGSYQGNITQATNTFGHAIRCVKVNGDTVE